MTNLDHIFGDVLGQLEELQADAKAIVEKRTEKKRKKVRQIVASPERKYYI